MKPVVLKYTPPSAPGYTLWNVEDRHREHPDTFMIPEQSERAGLHAGDLAKVIFDVEGWMAERMWVEITSSRVDPQLGLIYTGKLSNHPACIPVGHIPPGTPPGTAVFPNPLRYGLIVEFRPVHIASIETANANASASAN